jgi:hypothetical protein
MPRLPSLPHQDPSQERSREGRPTVAGDAIWSPRYAASRPTPPTSSFSNQPGVCVAWWPLRRHDPLLEAVLPLSCCQCFASFARRKSRAPPGRFGRASRHGGPCQQPHRDRPRTPESSTPSDARAEDRPYRPGRRRRSRLHPEPSAGASTISATDVPAASRLADAFAELALAI